jgi:hypothetical protein
VPGQIQAQVEKAPGRHLHLTKVPLPAHAIIPGDVEGGLVRHLAALDLEVAAPSIVQHLVVGQQKWRGCDPNELRRRWSMDAPSS